MGWVHDLFSENPVVPQALEVQAADHDWNAPDRLTKLERDLTRAELLLRALTETVLRNGLVTRQEIEIAARNIDQRERQAEQGEPEPAMTPEEHLARLEHES